MTWRALSISPYRAVVTASLNAADAAADTDAGGGGAGRASDGNAGQSTQV